MMLRSALKIGFICEFILRRKNAVYSLVLADGGPMLREVRDGTEPPIERRPNQMINRTGMSDFARYLSNLLRTPLPNREDGTFLSVDRALPVVDETGLKGVYMVTLTFRRKWYRLS